MKYLNATREQTKSSLTSESIRLLSSVQTTNVTSMLFEVNIDSYGMTMKMILMKLGEKKKSYTLIRFDRECFAFFVKGETFGKEILRQVVQRILYL